MVRARAEAKKAMDAEPKIPRLWPKARWDDIERNLAPGSTFRSVLCSCSVFPALANKYDSYLLH